MWQPDLNWLRAVVGDSLNRFNKKSEVFSTDYGKQKKRIANGGGCFVFKLTAAFRNVHNY